MAAKYRRVDPRFWKDEKVRLLSLSDKAFLLYLFTGQANRIGLFSFSQGAAIEDLGISLRTFGTKFPELCEKFSIKWASDDRVLYLPTWWKYNLPDNPSHLQGCLSDLHDVPQTALMVDFGSNTKYLPDDHKEVFLQYVRSTHAQVRGGRVGARVVRRGGTPQAQEQEQEQEQEHELEGRPLSPQKIQSLWNSIPGVKTCRDMGKVIRTRLLSRIKEHPERAWWDGLFAQVRASDFLCGRTNNSRGPFQASLSWALGPENLEKILAGNYDNPKPVNGQPSPCCQFRVSNGRFNKACGEPCVLGSKYCEQHQSVRSVTLIQEVHP